MNLNELYFRNEISTKAYNLCKSEKIATLEELLQFLINNGSFENIEGCGPKINLELIELIKKGGGIKLDTQLLLFYRLRVFSKQTINCCVFNADLKTIRDLLSYYDEHRNFRKIRNLGKKSICEIMNFIEDIKGNDQYNVFMATLQKEKNPLILIFEKLTIKQQQVINFFIKFKFTFLPVRNQNNLRYILDRNIDLESIKNEIIFKDQFSFFKVKNVGSKSAVELNKFLKSLIVFVNDMASIHDEKIIEEKRIKYMLESYFRIKNRIPQSIIESNSVFKIVEYLVFNDYIYINENESYIFKNYIYIFSDVKQKTISEVAKKLTLSIERVRQIANNILDDFNQKFSFLLQLNLYTYDSLRNENYIIVNDIFQEKLNVQNNVRFSKQFYILLFNCCFKDVYDLVGNVKNVLTKKEGNVKQNHFWKNVYLLNKNSAIKFNYLDFVQGIKLKIEDKISKKYELNLINYLKLFLDSSENFILYEEYLFFKTLIISEFSVSIKSEKYLVFKRNTKKYLPEYIEEIISEYGNPMSLKMIYEVFENIDEIKPQNLNSLRGACLRSENIMSFGKTSTYGLKKWEAEREHINGGTIKEIVLDYLEQFSEPIHIMELLAEVNKNYNSTPKNIYTNLKLNTKEVYVFFNQSFVGLKSKKYNSNLTEIPRFLGKFIRKYIIQNGVISKTRLINYISNTQNISVKNSNFIIEKLIDDKYVKTKIEENILYIFY